MSMTALLKGVHTPKKRKIDENASSSQVNKNLYLFSISYNLHLNRIKILYLT